MNRPIDLDKAADAEIFGSLAVHSGVPLRTPADHTARFTPAQANALEKMAHTFLEIARENGAEKKPLVFGDISLDLQKNGSEEILSIRTAAAA
jgi:hypothetical protein